MCGRFTLTVTASKLGEVFDVPGPDEHFPRFNIAPTQVVPVLRNDKGGRKRFFPCRWGLVPYWARDLSFGARLINARSETAEKKPAFREALARRRCLIPSDGFFEWMKTPSGRQPYYIRFQDRRVFALAGLWERWSRAPGPAVETFTILTTSPNGVVRPIHERMPVILAPETYSEWLQPQPIVKDRLERIFAPFPDDGLEAVRVSKRVNKPEYDDPQCLEGEQ